MNTSPSRFLETPLYREPLQALESQFQRQPHGEALRNHLEAVLAGGLDADEQERRAQGLLQGMLDKADQGRLKSADEANLAFTLHRYATAAQGYDVNASASSDVDEAFRHPLGLAEEGKIVVMGSVARNLPGIVDMLDELGIDQGRLIVVETRAALALQMHLMDDQKRAAFEMAVAGLSAEQVYVTDLDHVGDVLLDPDEGLIAQEKQHIALLFGPRQLAIYAKMQSLKEVDAVARFRHAVDQLLQGFAIDRFFLPMAYSDPYKGLAVSHGPNRKGALQTKLTGVSSDMVYAAAEEVQDHGYQFVVTREDVSDERGAYLASDVNALVEHGKKVQSFHFALPEREDV